jgi:hypothetical protein
MRVGLLVIGATTALGLGGVLARMHTEPSPVASAVQPLEWRLPGHVKDFLCPDTLVQPLIGLDTDGGGLTQI